MKQPEEKWADCSLAVLTYNAKEQCGELKHAINKITPVQFIFSKNKVISPEEKARVIFEAGILLRIAKMIVDKAGKI